MGRITPPSARCSPNSGDSRRNWQCVIRKHHDPLALDIPMVNAVMVADLVAKELKIGYDGDDGLNEEFSMLHSKLEISEEEYEHLTEFAERERENIEALFQNLLLIWSRGYHGDRGQEFAPRSRPSWSMMPGITAKSKKWPRTTSRWKPVCPPRREISITGSSTATGMPSAK